MTATVHLGFELGSGAAVAVPLRHMVVTGQTQEAGKTTTLEALIARSGVKAVAFITKRGEASFGSARVIPPYFREQADWQFVASILEASRGEKLKFERAWIIRASKGARTLADVQRNVRKALESAKGLSADVYLTLEAYLEAVVPQIDRIRWATHVELAAGVSAMDLAALNVEMQHLVIRSTIDWVLNHEQDTVVVVPEAWKFIPQGRGTPVKLAAEAYIRQAAGLRNYLWLDSQDIAGVEKMILKSVPVWILGVQRESNEVKRTLDQIPAGIKKPKPDQIATLGLGQFFACYGTHVVKVYAQPVWLGDAHAIALAQGNLDAHRVVKPGEVQVTEAEARALRDENTELKRRIQDLERLVAEGRPAEPHAAEHRTEARKPAAGLVPVQTSAGAGPALELPDLVFRRLGGGDELYQAIKARLIAEAPGILQVLTLTPEMEVTVERRTLAVDGSSIKGRIARILREGFFHEPRGCGAVRGELKRTGADVNTANIGRALDEFKVAGFVTEPSHGQYQEVPAMTVRILDGNGR